MKNKKPTTKNSNPTVGPVAFVKPDLTGPFKIEKIISKAPIKK